MKKMKGMKKRRQGKKRKKVQPVQLYIPRRRNYFGGGSGMLEYVQCTVLDTVFGLREDGVRGAVASLSIDECYPLLRHKY